jgi:hypothetical protein
MKSMNKAASGSAVPSTKAANRRLTEKLNQERQVLEQAAFRATLPLRLLQLLAKAQGRSDTQANLYDHPDAGLRIEFKFRAAPGQEFEQEEVLRLTSEPWEIDAVEVQFDRLDAEELERARIRMVAQEGYDLLSPEQRKALGVHRPF